MARGQKIRSGDVQVSGLPELSKALKALGPEAQKELKETSKKVAGFVASDARSLASGLGGVAAKAAPSIRPVGGVNGAGVSFGGAAYPFAGGAEFGSVRFKQFQPWRGSGPSAGYFLYPAIRQDLDRIESEYLEGLDDIIKRRFPQ